MIIKDQKFDIMIWATNSRHFKELGYNCKQGDKLIVNIDELQNTSSIKVEVYCDYCLEKKEENVILKRYDVALKEQNNNIKHSCLKCRYKKSKQTCLDKYGVEYSWQAKTTKDKIKQTNIERYGYEQPMHNEQIKNKVFTSMVNSMYKNKTGPCSKQQKYIHQLIGGELNYPFNRSLLDIAFLESKVYIEYDGSGHDLSLRFQDISFEDFQSKEMKRKKFLENKGWKLIRIISKNDLLPSDNKILKIISFCEDYLINQNHSWIEIDINNSKIRCSSFNKKIELGLLRSISKGDIIDE